jgi:hypothetical protein
LFWENEHRFSKNRRLWSAVAVHVSVMSCLPHGLNA